MKRRQMLGAIAGVAFAGCHDRTRNENPTPTSTPTETEQEFNTYVTDDVEIEETKVMWQATRIGIKVTFSNRSAVGDPVFIKFSLYDGDNDLVGTEYRYAGVPGAMYGIGINETEKTFWLAYDVDFVSNVKAIDVVMISEKEYHEGSDVE